MPGGLRSISGSDSGAGMRTELRRRLRICYVLNTFDLGGAETVALDLARSHDPDRFEVEIVGAMDPPRNDPAEMLNRCRAFGVHAVSLRQPNLRSLRAVFRFWRYLKQGRFDIVVGHNRGSDYWAVRLGRLAGVKHRYWVRHLVYPDMDAHRIARYRSLARRVNRVFAVSETVRKACVEVEGVPAELVQTITNGIDTDRFSPLEEEGRVEVRRSLGHPEGYRMLLFVGRFSSQKAPEAFVSLVAELRSRGCRVRGYMCGQGPLGSELASLAPVVSGDVRILGLRSDIPKLLGSADLFVSTSRNEGLPLNVMEAMAAATPLVAPAIPQIAELVAGEPALSECLMDPPPPSGPVPHATVQGWADRVVSGLADPGALAAAGAAGRRTIVQRFSLQSMVAAYEAAYLQDCGLN